MDHFDSGKSVSVQNGKYITRCNICFIFAWVLKLCSNWRPYSLLLTLYMEMLLPKVVQMRDYCLSSDLKLYDYIFIDYLLSELNVCVG